MSAADPDLTRQTAESAPGGSVSAVAGDRMLRLEGFFHQVLDAPEGERMALADRLCAGDVTLLAELLDLLGAEVSVGELLASSHAAASEDDEHDPWLGRQVGPFVLEKVLGRGGMGVVYLGERAAGGDSADAVPHRRVAIKFVRRSLRGSPALQHFNLERDALAALEHPHIARLLDAGVTDESIPYVVMEFVQGSRLDHVADDPATSVTEIVGLLLQLSEAVAYVHRHLILHRDLKPGNVMVTGDEPGLRQVKLLDFGTLKMLGPEAVESAMTQAGMRPVTLRYASPEHIRGTAVSTASEVYSLGVILYRLFAGRLPEGLDNLPLSEYMERLAQGRLAPPSSLCTKPVDPELARDLDAIALKAMRFEPEQRYPTAEAFAQELRSALEHRPVAARGDSFRYRAGKFYQRNRITLWAGFAALLVLCFGMVQVARQARVARAQAHLAEAGVDGERRLAHLLLFDYFQKLAAIPGSTDAQRKAVADAITYLNGVAGTPAGHATTLELDEVQAYTSMGGLLGNPYEQNLGDPAAAVVTLRKGEVIARELSLRLPDDLAALRADALLEQMLGRVYLGDDKASEAESHMRRAARSGERIAANPAALAADFAIAASIEDSLGDVVGAHDMLGVAKQEDSTPMYSRSLALHREGLRRDAGCSRCRRGIGVELYKLGLNHEDNDPRQAAMYFRQSLAQFATGTPREQAAAPTQRMVWTVRQRLGMADVHIGQVAEGLQLLRESVQKDQATLDADPIDARARFDLATTESNYADACSDAGQKALALDQGRAMVHHMDILLRTDPQNKAWQIYRAGGMYRVAERLIESGRKSEGMAMIRSVQPFLTREAEAPDAPQYLLTSAVEAMLETGAEPAKTLEFAKRGMSVPPTVEQLRDLVEAAVHARDMDTARNAAQQLVTLVRTQHLIGGADVEAVTFAQKVLSGH